MFDLTHLSFPLESQLSAPTGVPGRVNLHGACSRFNARAAGDAEFESDLGNPTVETIRGVTHADIPRPDFPGFEDVNSAFSAWGDWGAFVISHVRSPLGTFEILIANSTGHGTYENPVAGTATWTDIVAAHTYAGDHVEGDAGLRCVAEA